MTRKLLSCCALLVGVFFQSFAQADEAALVLKRYKTFLLMTDTSTSCRKVPPVNADGRWSDIDYSDKQAGGWQLSQHMGRVKSLAVCLAKQSLPASEKTTVQKTISLALNDWFRHRYKSRNWWHNEIGIPQLVRDILVLSGDFLSAEQRTLGLEILNQHKVYGTGANLVWSADLGLHYGALTNDSARMRRCRDTILTVIKISTEEGVQPDYSFHQHGRRLQMYHYGGAFLLDDVRLGWQLQGTSLAFPADKIRILTDFVLQGWQWMARGIHTVPGTIDRAASRVNALRSADVRKIIPLLYELNPGQAPAFRQMLQIQNGKGALNGYRYFPYSDFTSFQRPRFSFFLKTHSTRTLLTESINEENLKGNLLNGGDAYFISTGTEYDNFMPFWDWAHLPGLTNFAGDENGRLVASTFVGNVSDGEAGLAAMDHTLKNGQQVLTVKKVWASWQNMTVALVAGLDSGELAAGVSTTLEQSRWQGLVTASAARTQLTEGKHVFAPLAWVHQHNFVYVPLGNDSITVELKSVSGRWYDINRSEPKTALTEKRFLVSLLHRQKASGYVVGYAPSLKKAASFAGRPAWEVLRNDTSCQAVSFRDGTVMAALYKDGQQKLSERKTVSVSRPCLFLQVGQRVWVSDPSHTGGRLTIGLNGKSATVDVPADGSSVTVVFRSDPLFKK